MCVFDLLRLLDLHGSLLVGVKKWKFGVDITSEMVRLLDGYCAFSCPLYECVFVVDVVRSEGRWQKQAV